MCDQTEVTYSPGDIVWVKLNHVWWPGQVYDFEKLPEEITANLRKTPIAVVKFFQEETFEYVKNRNMIYHYNCKDKEQFIKKGLDLVRSCNSRDVPSNMKMFPNDVVMAEHLSGGDPNILDSESFAPEQKSDYKDLFGSPKKVGKKGKLDLLKKEKIGMKNKRFSYSPVRSERRSLPTNSMTIPRPITHPRFIAKALQGRSDHEVRIRCQVQPPSMEDQPVEKHYNCHLCDFHTTRLNVIVLHNKSHSASFIEARRAISARSKAKEKERHSIASFSFSEKTPTSTPSVSNRGRVKSLPKKLIDYTEEPPAKMLKEKIPVSVKQELKEKSPEKSPSSKSLTKKEKENSEMKAIKRPLFGKRKTAKEKAELAAKIKQENEAMKEKLLRDWEDDEVNEEEVELDRLKQALDSTTMSSTEEDDLNNPVEESKKIEDKNVSVKEKLPELKAVEVKNDNKAKVFEFDDSEDSVPLTNFRLKKSSEKFTDDKFKKPKPPKPLSKISSKSKSVSLSPKTIEERKQEEEDKETAKFNEAFNALLEETVLPTLPDIPKSSQPISKPEDIIDQTSDISSSTDLLERSNGLGNLDCQTKEDVVDSRQDCELINNDLKMECTSSDNEEIVSTEQSVKLEEDSMDQKNSREISACDPSTEIDMGLTAGVATTSADNLECETVSGDSLQICEDYTTEITSTCDVTKSSTEESQQDVKCNLMPLESNTTGSSLSLPTTESESVTSQECKMNFYLPMDESSAFSNVEATNEKTTGKTLVTEQKQCESIEANPMPLKVEPKGDESEMKTDTHQNSDPKPKKQTFLTFSSDGNYQETDVVKEEVVTQEEEHSESIIGEVKQQTGQPVFRKVSPGKRSQPKISNKNLMSIQLIMPDGTECITTPIQIPSQQPSVEQLHSASSKIEISEGYKMDNQSMSQNLQDMELDINSMPVIIGGEEFIQPEPPKSSFVSIQPKYSESIVINPTQVSKAPSPKKTESVIMHLGEPSTSNKNLQSVISIPSKNVRNRGGGRSPKPATKTIKLPASTLKSLGFAPKPGNQQVLILKTTGGQSKQDKGTNQKNKQPLNYIQFGDKMLLVNSPIGSQNTIKLDPHQQQLLSQGGKLVPGTKVLTSKVIATTAPHKLGSSTDQIGTSQSISKSPQKVVISKSGLLSNTSKSVIINNSSGKVLTTVPGTQSVTTSKQTVVTQNLITTKGGLILPSSSPGASPSKTATIITSQALSTNKGLIFSPLSSKGETIISGNQKLRFVSSKAPLKGTRFVVQNTQGKLPTDSQVKGQVKLISGVKGQTGNTILIQTSQGIVAKSIASAMTTTTATARQTKRPEVVKTVLTTVPTQAKIRITSATAKNPQIICSQPQIIQQPQQTQIIQQSQKTQIIQQPKIVQPQQTQVIQQPQVVQQPQIIQQSQQTQIIKQPQQIKPQPEVVQHAQIIQQPQVTLQTTPVVKKVQRPRQNTAPKQPRQSTSQKQPRKSTPRAPKAAKGKTLTTSALTPPTTEQIILSTSSSLPVVGQTTVVQGQIPQNPNEVVYLTIDESGTYRQVDKSMVTFEGVGSEAPQTFFIPANNQIQDMGNLLIALDSAGNIVNLSQPAVSTSFATDVPTPGQDILAKALENTQVLQQETIIPDMDVSSALSTSMDSTVLTNSAFSDQTQYPPKLSHNVLETSLTLNQPPIMTPLEVPSAVSPNLGQISSLPSNYISSGLISSPQKHLSQSMPILNEETLANQAQGEPVFLLDSSNNLIPTTSGSLSFQLTLEDNNVIMTSGTGSGLPQYQVVSNQLLNPDLVATGETHGVGTVENVSENIISNENGSYAIVASSESEIITPDIVDAEQKSDILREALEAPQTGVKTENDELNTVEVAQNVEENHVQQESAFTDSFSNGTVEQQCEVVEDVEFVDQQESCTTENFETEAAVEDEVKHSLKRTLGEEETVSSSSDLEDSSKKMRIDET